MVRLITNKPNKITSEFNPPRITVIVTGHTNCGGVAAALEIASGHNEFPGTPLSDWLQPLANLAKAEGLPSLPPEEALKILRVLNVKQQVDNLSQSEVIEEAWKHGKNVEIHGWLYTLETGLLEDLCIRRTGPSV